MYVISVSFRISNAYLECTPAATKVTFLYKLQHSFYKKRGVVCELFINLTMKTRNHPYYFKVC